MARYKIEMEFGYISYDEIDIEKAVAVYKECGIRLFRCKDIFDEGELIDGPAVFQDHSNAVVN